MKWRRLNEEQVCTQKHQDIIFDIIKIKIPINLPMEMSSRQIYKPEVQQRNLA
jgi:hypothetical protein